MQTPWKAVQGIPVLTEAPARSLEMTLSVCVHHSLVASTVNKVRYNFMQSPPSLSLNLFRCSLQLQLHLFSRDEPTCRSMQLQ